MNAANQQCLFWPRRHATVSWRERHDSQICAHTPDSSMGVLAPRFVPDINRGQLLSVEMVMETEANVVGNQFLGQDRGCA